MVAALVASALLTRQLLWTPLTAIQMGDIINNQFQMTNAAFVGTDSAGEPFRIAAAIARQEYDRPYQIFFERIEGTTVRMMGGARITDNISARRGEFNRETRRIYLRGNVRVISSNGDRILTEELVIRL